MNVLIDRLPEAVEIDGKVYELNTDFRAGIQIMIAFEDSQLTQREKLQVMVELLYRVTPRNLQRAAELAVQFLNCGESDEGQKQAAASSRLYSFQKDAVYIYSAIRQSHGIDLESVEALHWWKFCYLFLDLSEDCFFNRMLYYRRRMAEGKLTKEEAVYCNAIRDILSLPEEPGAEDEFMRLLQEADKK